MGKTEVLALAQRLVDAKAVPLQFREDAMHIAFAAVSNMDYLVSWNFKHLVNVKTINGVRAITNLKGFTPIDIITPEMLLKGDE